MSHPPYRDTHHKICGPACVRPNMDILVVNPEEPLDPAQHASQIVVIVPVALAMIAAIVTVACTRYWFLEHQSECKIFHYIMEEGNVGEGLSAVNDDVSGNTRYIFFFLLRSLNCFFSFFFFLIFVSFSVFI